MNIAIFGTGYVGLVTGSCFADVGNHVSCIDVNQKKIKILNTGISPIYEPGLNKLIQKNIIKKRLLFTTDPTNAILDAEIIFITVGTPQGKNGSVDLKYVLRVSEIIGNNLNGYKVIVNKSTVPVGTEYKVTEIISNNLKNRNVKYNFDVVSNPEFLKEGDAIFDCMNPDRIIIGTNSSYAAEIMKNLYAPFDPNKNRLMIMDIRSAEMTKYVANAMLATKISFMNEMSQIAERVGADIEKVRIGIGSDHRIGYHFIYPGCGYGGSCFPKDVQALNQIAQKKGYHPKILSAIHAINKQQKGILFRKCYQYFSGKLKGKTMTIWGLAFKPKTDDLREAPSLKLIEKLWKFGVNVQIHDPAAMKNFLNIYGMRKDYQLFNNAYDALTGSDALFIVTEWESFKSPNFYKIINRLNKPVIFDGRNLYNKIQLKAKGIDYISIGR